MALGDSSATHDPVTLRRLFAAYLDGKLSDAEASRLDAHLLSSRAAADAFEAWRAEIEEKLVSRPATRDLFSDADDGEDDFAAARPMPHMPQRRVLPFTRMPE